MNKLFITYLIWNSSVILIYGIDKICAKRGLKRISELTLVTFSFLLGGFGAMFGMILFNHKTSKIKFRFLVPIAAILNIILLFGIRNLFFY